MTGELQALLSQAAPILALAPMQDITDLAFWRLLSGYSGPDLYVTEYFRVYPGSRLDKHILKSITANPTGRPVVAQMIGNDIPALVRTARELQQYPIAAVDLNLGCPAPVVYRKCAGGGLLKFPAQIDLILGALRDCIASTAFTVKTRIGFDSSGTFSELLPLFAKHRPDLLTVHARTVKEMYRSEVHYEFIARAVAELPCPVLANGNVYSGARAAHVLEITGARGVMIGRSAIRNPWIFEQTRRHLRGEPFFVPRGHDVLDYVRRLYAASSGWEEGGGQLNTSVSSSRMSERARVQRIKKHLNYIGMGVEPTGGFLHRMRRASTEAELFAVCQEYLDHHERMPLEPFSIVLKDADLLAGQHR